MRAALMAAVLVWSSAAFADDAPPQPAPGPCDTYTADAVATCDAAIASAADDKVKSALLAHRAYAKDVAKGTAAFRDVLADLDQALALDPVNLDARHERAFVYDSVGRWKEAEADLDFQIRMLPNEASGYRERALSRFNLGNLQGAFEDRDAEVRFAPSASALLGRAHAAMWLGRFDAAEQDIGAARKLGAGNANAEAAASRLSAELTFWRSTSPQGAKACDPSKGQLNPNNSFLIGDCTRRFLTAPSPRDKAEALSARSLAWITGANDVVAFIEDSAIAVTFDPANPNLRSNLGFAYIRLNRPAPALAQFDAAIAVSPDYTDYAGRAQARFGLGDLDGAESDANASMAYQPNRIALTVLGDISYVRTKKFDKAKEYWMQAYTGGPPDAGLVRRLTAAGVTLPGVQQPQLKPAPAPPSESNPESP
jgi:tetratricopeptide (TPR) repeat protein